MMKSLAPFITAIAILITITVIAVSLLNYRLKDKIISSGPLDDKAFKFFRLLSSMGEESLKWGIIVLFGGIGLVLLQFIPYSVDDSPLPYGVEAIFVATGFLVYYFVSRSMKEK